MTTTRRKSARRKKDIYRDAVVLGIAFRDTLTELKYLHNAAFVNDLVNEIQKLALKRKRDRRGKE